ncbi:Outer dense fiber 2 [Babesia ovata]|uniref:Outer dense fiber 2 n=1 Tax=Babesia ovata TaxID=189622 RepID=A0A2H6K6I6_9APIC|nr:Outer dense fiber 2 [Babesia ovata]GBE58601.1 Outer dense fiber 2 [Babesia ovata]
MAGFDVQSTSDQYLKTFQRHEAASRRGPTSPDESSELSHLAKLKGDIDVAFSRIQQSLQNKSLTQGDWQKVIDLRQGARLKLDSANARIDDLIKMSASSTDRVLACQVQRYRRIFDQLTDEFRLLGKQVDQRYQSFALFGDNRHPSQPLDMAVNSGQVVVEAIMDVESLTEQASLNLGVLRSGNDRMARIYARVNTMVHEHLFDIHKLQRNINYVLLRNRTVTSLVMGFCLFLIIYKLILSKIV